MTWSGLFCMISFLTLLHPGYSETFIFQGAFSNHAKKENIKCVSNHITKEDLPNQSTDFFERDKRQANLVKERRVKEGTDFMYECCGNLKKEAIFKWGLYKRGVSSPSRLFSRVKVAKAKSFCSAFWTPEFKNSTYFGRTFAEYNTSSKCVLWILSNVTREDENIFVAAVRDNFAQGHGFRECTPVSLNVFKAETHVPTTPTLQTTPVKTQKPAETHVPTTPTLQTTPVTTQKPEPSATTSEPTSTTTTTTSKPSPPNESLKWWLWLLIVLAIVSIVAIVVAVLICIKCPRKCKWQCHWREINHETKDEDERRSNDNLLLKEVKSDAVGNQSNDLCLKTPLS